MTEEGARGAAADTPAGAPAEARAPRRRTGLRRSGPGWWARLRRRWAGVPLVTRLVGIVTVLLALGLVLAGATSAALLEGTLTGQVDKKLQTEGLRLARQALDPASFGGAAGPSDYYLRIQVGPFGEWDFQSPSSQAVYGVPDVPDLTAAVSVAMRKSPLVAR